MQWRRHENHEVSGARVWVHIRRDR